MLKSALIYIRTLCNMRLQPVIKDEFLKTIFQNLITRLLIKINYKSKRRKGKTIKTYK